MATCYSSYDISQPQPQQQVARTPQVQQKDYSRPLHVDCSVEYELPNQAKPPVGVRNEPLLMIHPCYFRKIESQRKSTFVNNLPTRQQIVAKRKVAVQQQKLQQQQQHQQQVLHQQQQQQPLQQVQQPQPHHVQYPVQFTAAMERHPQQQQQQPQQQPQQLWEPLPPLMPTLAAAQAYVVKRDPMLSGCGTYTSSGSGDSGHWTDTDKSPERKTEDNKQHHHNHHHNHHHQQQHQQPHILSGKYRQYLRAHRLHPYVTSSIPIASTFPQIQQVCYNV